MKYEKDILINTAPTDSIKIEKVLEVSDGRTVFIYKNSKVLVSFYFHIPTEQYSVSYQKIIFNYLQKSFTISVFEKIPEKSSDLSLELPLNFPTTL